MSQVPLNSYIQPSKIKTDLLRLSIRIQLLLLLLFYLTNTALSQTDSLFFGALYESRVANKASEPVFNGPMHIGYDRGIQGIPYYLSDAWQRGTLVYQHIPYKDIYLKYDLVTGEVVVRHLNKNTGVILFTPWIQSFSLGDRFFVQLEPADGSGLTAGIYEQICKGKMSLFIKRSKTIEESIVSNTVERKFVDNIKFYVLKGDHYYPIKKQKDLAQLLEGKKAQVYSSLKSSGIKYKFNHELAITRMVEYYNQLSQ